MQGSPRELAGDDSDEAEVERAMGEEGGEGYALAAEEGAMWIAGI